MKINKFNIYEILFKQLKLSLSIFLILEVFYFDISGNDINELH